MNRSGWRLVLIAAALALGIFTLLRLILVFLNWPLLPHTFPDLLGSLWTGLRYDLIVVAILGLPGALWAGLRREDPARKHSLAGGCLLCVGWFLFLYLNAADAFFFDEFNSHFNYVAVEYIFVNGEEVLRNISQSYPVVPITLLLLLIAIFLTNASRRWSRPSPARASGRAPAWAFLWILATTGLFFSTPLRPISAERNRALDEIGNNGFFTLGYALITSDMAYGAYYESLPQAEAIARVREKIRQSGQRYLPGDVSIERHVPGGSTAGRMNVVLILEESFGSEFVDAVYPRPAPLTPAFSKLVKEGLFFNRIYATGNRTVRGLEGVLASFPPIPGGSIIKRKPERPVPTLATVLKGKGYRTSFIYGGRGLFDNMRSFMMRNGFDTFIEQKDFASPVYTTAWGVSDEDIFKKADETFETLSRAQEPFFSVILTVSNHRPYLYPKGRIDLDPAAQAREHAVKYADWAIGRFFEEAKGKRYFANTLFVLLGDHGARVYGADFIPIRSYEIPLLMYAPSRLRPRIVDTIGGSMDVGPTLLGILGIDYDSPFFGRDLLRVPPKEGYALMQHDRDISFFDGDRLAVLSTPRSSALFRYDPAHKTFSADVAAGLLNKELIKTACAFYQTAYLTFENALTQTAP